MDSFPKIFLDDLTQKIFPGNAPPKIQYWTFMYRFECDNYSLRHTEIGKKLTDTVGGDCESGINQFIKEVIKKIDYTFRDELTQDGITEEMLGLRKKEGAKGRKKGKTESPWQVAYKWLWEVKYPRWQQNYIWDSWKQVAKPNSEWIQFNIQPGYRSRGIKRGIKRGMKPTWKKLVANNTLPINTPLNCKIQIDKLGSYLILFSRGLDIQGQTTKYLITPSQAFAPKYQLLDESTLIPQRGAMCEEIEFDAVGKEEYLGIVVDEALDLPWLTPDPANPALEWQGIHLAEVWEELQKQDNWRVFYRDFDVVAQDAQAA